MVEHVNHAVAEGRCCRKLVNTFSVPSLELVKSVTKFTPTTRRLNLKDKMVLLYF